MSIIGAAPIRRSSTTSRTVARDDLRCCRSCPKRSGTTGTTTDRSRWARGCGCGADGPIHAALQQRMQHYSSLGRAALLLDDRHLSEEVTGRPARGRCGVDVGECAPARTTAARRRAPLALRPLALPSIRGAKSSLLFQVVVADLRSSSAAAIDSTARQASEIVVCSASRYFFIAAIFRPFRRRTRTSSTNASPGPTSSPSPLSSSCTL